MHLATPAALADDVGRFWTVPASGVVATCGTTGANTATLLAAYSCHKARRRHGGGQANADGHIVVERPTYQPLMGVAQGLGIHVTSVDRDPSQGWRLRPDAVADAVDDDCFLVVLASPNNPTGAASSAADLAALAGAAASHDAWTLVDQVYQPLTDVPVAAVPNSADEGALPGMIATAGFNKTFGAASLRTGWLASDEETAAAIQKAHVLTHLSPPAAGVAIGRALLAEADACRLDLAERIAENRAHFDSWCRESGALAAPPQSGDAYLAPHNPLTIFPRLEGTNDTLAFCQAARAAGILVLPGEFFGHPGHVRIGLGGDPHRFARALAAFEALLKQTAA